MSLDIENKIKKAIAESRRPNVRITEEIDGIAAKLDGVQDSSHPDKYSYLDKLLMAATEVHRAFGKEKNPMQTVRDAIAALLYSKDLNGGTSYPYGALMQEDVTVPDLCNMVEERLSHMGQTWRQEVLARSPSQSPHEHEH
jgi:hypothetical protein